MDKKTSYIVVIGIVIIGVIILCVLFGKRNSSPTTTDDDMPIEAYYLQKNEELKKDYNVTRDLSEVPFEEMTEEEVMYMTEKASLDKEEYDEEKVIYGEPEDK